MQEVIYTASDGTQMPIKDVHNDRLINSLAKCYREIYTSKNDEEFDEYVKKIDMLKNEIHRRINDFREKKDNNE